MIEKDRTQKLQATHSLCEDIHLQQLQEIGLCTQVLWAI